MKKNIYIIMAALCALMLASCGQKKEEPSSAAFETATAAAEVETEAPAETKAPEKDYSALPVIETYEIVKPEQDVYGVYSFQMPPEIGEPAAEVAYALWKKEDGSGYDGETMTARTVALPEWGIASITLDASLFPEDESNILKLDESKIIKRKLDSEELEFCGYGADEEVEVYDYAEKIFLDQYGYDMYDEAVVDLSPLYPGSLTLCSPLTFFQLFVTDIDFELTDELIESHSTTELFDMLYPYTMKDIARKYDEYENGIGRSSVTRTKDGTTYVYIACVDEPNRSIVQPLKEDEDFYRKRGGVFMRIKDGKCQGIISRAATTGGIGRALYGFANLKLYDMDHIGVESCERVRQVG